MREELLTASRLYKALTRAEDGRWVACDPGVEVGL